jgi:hypothetical protein
VWVIFDHGQDFSCLVMLCFPFLIGLGDGQENNGSLKFVEF